MKRFSLCLSILLTISISQLKTYALNPAHTFALGDSVFLLDGKPFMIVSGEMHYPRIPRACWRERMKAAKAMGLNAISTYVFWNLHEPQQGHYTFSGNNDIAAFIKTAAEEGLWVILRPSPYVCAEWEFGGYPYWLQKIPNLKVRSRESQYLNAYKKYIYAVGKQLAKFQVHRGGNVLMVQLENEYGFHSNDKEYLEINRKMFVDAGFDGPLYTCDPAWTMQKGHLPGMLPAVNGSDNPQEVKTAIRKYHAGKGPFFISEWYPAWFDWWGAVHHTVPAENFASKLDSVLKAGISINMYMFHGGTTRGFMNGANINGNNPYEPQISSYDYDAPLNEAGNVTNKFKIFRSVIQKNLPAGQQLPEMPNPHQTMSIPDIVVNEVCPVFDKLPTPVEHVSPLTFEDLNQAYGFVLYRTEMDNPVDGLLKIKDLRDYAILFVNGKRVGVLDRRLRQDSLMIDFPTGKVTLDIFVENMGRINFGKYLMDNKKGITEKVLLNAIELKGWKMYSLPFEKVNVTASKVDKCAVDQPVIRKGTFLLNTVADTHLDMSNWGKGMVWVNGFNLGKYWAIGPQQSLYIPKQWLRKGKNRIVILELLKPQQNITRGITEPILNKIQ